MTITTVVEIVCDSPNHTRGKVAKIASYYRNAEDGEWYGIGGSGLFDRPRRIERDKDRSRTYGDYDEADPDRILKLAIFGAPTVRRARKSAAFSPECKLCGRGLPNGFTKLSGVKAILDRVAAGQQRSISIADLHVLASRGQKG